MTTEQLPDWGDSTIRFAVSQATPGDRREVEKLIRACGRHVKDYFDMRNLQDYWERGHVWVLNVEGVEPPIGFAVVYPQVKRPVLSLYDIGIHPEWRRFGLGTALMRSIWDWHVNGREKAEQPRLEALRLVVNEDNTVAIDAYRKWGLETIELKETRRNGRVVVMEGKPWT